MTPGSRYRTEAVGPRFIFAALACALTAIGCIVVTAPAQAAPILGLLDYQGFVYESAPAGTPGSQLGGVGTVDTWFFPFHNPLMNYTWTMGGLVGQSGMEIGGGTSIIEYTGGTFSIFEDPLDNANYDAIPGNGQADPVGFDDGTLWLACAFTNFQLFWNDGEGIGNFSGDLIITGGAAASAFASSSAYTFGGATNRTLLAEGYPRKVDGALEGPIVPEPSSLMLMGLPMAGWVGLLRRRTNRAKSL